MRRPAHTALLAAGLAAALGLAAWWVGGDGYVEGGPQIRSSLRTSPDGVAALSRAVERLGTPAAIRTTPFVDADALRGTLVTLEPGAPPSPREVGAALAWVRQGGTLLYAPRPGGGREAEAQPLLLDSLGLAARPTRDGDGPTLSSGAADDPPAPQWAPHPLTEDLSPPKPVDRTIVRDSAAQAAGDRPAVRIDTLLASSGEEDGLGFAAAVVSVGRGRIVLFASAAPLSNANVGADPLGHLAIRAAVAYTPAPDTVFFDEFHHGVHGLGSPLGAAYDFALRTPAGRAVLHGTLALVAALAFAGVRLGAPRDPRPEERRSPLEHVAALASLYEQAGARSTAALLLTARLARVHGLPAPRSAAEADELFAAVERKPGNQDALDRVRRAWRADPPDLPAIAGGIDQCAERNKAK